jgi:lipopolysaccharide export LptBFGC system permease protein LptF
MPSLLDRYVIKSFLYSYLVCLVSLVGLTVVFDAFMRIGDFLEAAHSEAVSAGVLSVMLQYYSVRLPVIFHAVSPAITLTAAMFCMAQLNRNNELIPMRASGISLFRTLAPIFLFAIFITGVLVAVQERLIPSLKDRIREYEVMIDRASDRDYLQLELTDACGNNWSIHRYERNTMKMTNQVLITSFYEGTSKTKVHVQAESGKWKLSEGDGEPRWHLSNGKEFRYDEERKLLSASEGNYDTRFGVDGYVLLRPEDGGDNFYRIRTNFGPQDIAPEDKGVLFLSTSELRARHIEDPVNNEIGVALHGRYAFPFANLVLLMLGLPFVLGTESKSTFGGLIICIAICAAYYGVNALCTELGRIGTLSAVAAAWLPIALFGPLGIFLFDGVKT